MRCDASFVKVQQAKPQRTERGLKVSLESGCKSAGAAEFPATTDAEYSLSPPTPPPPPLSSSPRRAHGG